MKTYRVELTEQEMKALSGLLDAGVRAVGIRAVKGAAALLDKIETAISEVQNGDPSVIIRGE